MAQLVVGRLLPDDTFLREGDEACNAYQRLGVFDIDEEELCHKEIKNLVCAIPTCGTKLNSLMELELHYNSIHRYTCATCRKSYASGHLLDLHIEETHDSFFAVQAERKPMYRCLVETCTERFTSSQERHSHCIDHHAFPSNFRWVTPKVTKPKSKKGKCVKEKTKDNSSVKVDMCEDTMDVEENTENFKRSETRKVPRGFVFGRGNVKKSFNPKSAAWYQSDRSKPTVSALEGSSLTSDLMDTLPNDMS